MREIKFLTKARTFVQKSKLNSKIEVNIQETENESLNDT